jgi:hypothetical protein
MNSQHELKIKNSIDFDTETIISSDNDNKKKLFMMDYNAKKFNLTNSKSLWKSAISTSLIMSEFHQRITEDL